MRSLILVLCLLLFIPMLVSAQDDPALPKPQRVELTAADGLTLIGDYYPLSESEMPTVFLLHQTGGDRHSWDPIIPIFLQNGYNVLNPDQRAHGETGGDRDLAAAIGDVQVWMDWLREQPSVDDNAISTIGSSWGTVTALAGCAADAACVTAIAISPGDFPLLNDAMFESMSERSILFIVGKKDNVLFDTQKLFDRTVGESVMYVANTGLHGVSFFSSRSTYKIDITNLILDWLKDHLP